MRRPPWGRASRRLRQHRDHLLTVPRYAMLRATSSRNVGVVVRLGGNKSVLHYFADCSLCWGFAHTQPLAEHIPYHLHNVASRAGPHLTDAVPGAAVSHSACEPP